MRILGAHEHVVQAEMHNILMRAGHLAHVSESSINNFMQTAYYHNSDDVRDLVERGFCTPVYHAGNVLIGACNQFGCLCFLCHAKFAVSHRITNLASLFPSAFIVRINDFGGERLDVICSECQKLWGQRGYRTLEEFLIKVLKEPSFRKRVTTNRGCRLRFNPTRRSKPSA